MIWSQFNSEIDYLKKIELKLRNVELELKFKKIKSRN